MESKALACLPRFSDLESLDKESINDVAQRVKDNVSEIITLDKENINDEA